MSAPGANCEDMATSELYSKVGKSYVGLNHSQSLVRLIQRLFLWNLPLCICQEGLFIGSSHCEIFDGTTFWFKSLQSTRSYIRIIQITICQLSSDIKLVLPPFPSGACPLCFTVALYGTMLLSEDRFNKSDPVSPSLPISMPVYGSQMQQKCGSQQSLPKTTVLAI